MYFFFFKFTYASVWWCSAKKSAVYIWVFFSFSFNSWQVCKILWYLRNVKNYQLKFVFYKPEIALMVSKKICFYVSKIKNNVNYKWLREREREHVQSRCCHSIYDACFQLRFLLMLLIQKMPNYSPCQVRFLIGTWY